MKKINMDVDDVCNSMGASQSFKELVGTTIEIDGMMISTIDGNSITTMRGTDGEYYSGNSQPVRKTAEAILDTWTDAISDEVLKEDDFKYNVEFSEGGNGKRTYMLAKFKRVK